MAENAAGGSSGTSGPLYSPQYQALGGSPSLLPDVPICAVFLGLFTFAAAAHMGLFQVNLHKKEKKFAFNAATFGFCFTRILATSLRIAWAYHPRNIALGLSAQIFVYAGVPILFLCNLFWAQRIVRAQHPTFGWSRPFSLWIPILIVITVLTIFALISAVVTQFFVEGAYTQHWTRAIQLYGATFFAVTAVLPIPIEIISTLARFHPSIKVCKTDNFGSGSIASKIRLSILSAWLLSLGACYRAITSWQPQIPLTQPTVWYFSKPPFYIFNFTIEILVVFGWLLLRVDKRYIVPDGAKGPHSYGNAFIFAGEAGTQKFEMYSSTRHLTSNRTSTLSFSRPFESRDTLHQDSMIASTSFSKRTSAAPSWDAGDLWQADDECYRIPPIHLLHEQANPLTEADMFPLPPSSPSGIPGADHEMSFDPKSGKWEIRSLSEKGPGSETVTSDVGAAVVEDGNSLEGK